jgi:O-antigen/teichoic acid export membrane protein
LGPSSVRSAEPMALIVVASLAAVSAAIALPESLLRGLRHIRGVNLASVVQSITQLLVVFVVARLGSLDVTRALAITLLSTMMRLALLVWGLRGESEVRPRRGQIQETLRMLLAYGITYQVYSLLWVCHARMDVLMLERLQGADRAGVYATGANLAQLLWRAPNALMFVTLPHLARMKRDQDAVDFAAKSARIAAPGLVVLALLGYASANFAIPLLYGANFQAASASFDILLPGVVASALHMLLSNSFVAAGHLRLLVKNCAATLAAIIGLTYLWLIPRYGDVGAAIASSITYTLLFALTARDACRISGKGFTDMLVIKRSDWLEVRRALTSRVAVR